MDWFSISQSVFHGALTSSVRVSRCHSQFHRGPQLGQLYDCNRALPGGCSPGSSQLGNRMKRVRERCPFLQLVVGVPEWISSPTPHTPYTAYTTLNSCRVCSQISLGKGWSKQVFSNTRYPRALICKHAALWITQRRMWRVAYFLLDLRTSFV